MLACFALSYLGRLHARGGWGISAFIESQGYSIVEFYERLREARELDPWSKEAVFGKIMTATADFDIFMTMMREAAEGQNTGRREDAHPPRK